MDLALADKNALTVCEFIFVSKMATGQVFGRTAHHWVTEKESKHDRLDHRRSLHSQPFGILCCPSQGSSWTQGIFFHLFVA